jgi:predicted aminopeptidase
VNSSSNVPKVRAALLLALIAASQTGCYLLESAQGQLSLMAAREPIARVIGRATTSPALRTQLERVTSIRDFASRELKLPDNGSYRSYADVHRPYVVWNVVAAPEFSVDARLWCFPIVGCVAYRGYFALQRARVFAARLRAKGYDVSIDGVAAYSTLGHFDDPILNTMLGWDDVELAAIMFHELTHQLLYVPGDASFNEALATTVEEEGVRRWLLAQGRAADLTDHERKEARYLQVVDLLRRTRARLSGIYASGVDTQRMRQQKRQTLAKLREEYAGLEAQWGGHAPFEAWFRDDLNNAHLASISTYYDCVPGFRRELESSGGDLGVFYRRVGQLAKLDKAARDAAVCQEPTASHECDINAAPRPSIYR